MRMSEGDGSHSLGATRKNWERAQFIRPGNTACRSVHAGGAGHKPEVKQRSALHTTGRQHAVPGARRAWRPPLEQSGPRQAVLQLSQDARAKGKAEGQAVK